MNRTLVSTERFRRAYHRLSDDEQQLVDRALQQLASYLETGRASVGLGVKKLGAGVFEVRAGLALRIVYVADDAHCVLTVLGNHDEVRRFLKRQ